MSSPRKLYAVLAYYSFVSIEEPLKQIEAHKQFLQDKDAKARIYVSEQGINGQMSIAQDEAHAYIDWLHAIPEFQDMPIKVQHHHEHAFPRLTIKYRKQLVAIDTEVDITDNAEHVSPEQWCSMLEEQNKYLVIDVRNDYETEVGHFEQAICPPLKNFRDFPQYIETLKKEHDPQKTKVMMCCTGGIRCEVYSALMKKQGFTNVYQLEGGIINYGQRMGNKHWKGKLFVFDDRLTVPIAEDAPEETISQCHLCQQSSDHIYNCANMDCNHLFIACDACLEKFQGCCSSSCIQAPRTRPLEHQTLKKPFRKWYEYFKHKTSR